MELPMALEESKEPGGAHYTQERSTFTLHRFPTNLLSLWASEI